MVKFSHFLGGHCTVTITAPFLPRLLNLCATENLLFWGLHWKSATELSLSIPQNELESLTALVARQGGILSIEKESGFPLLLKRLRRRIGFILGMTLSLLAVTLLSRFVFVIEITGNQRVSSGEIRLALERAGLTSGTYGGGLPLSQMTQATLSQLEGISWMSINIHGTRATVQVVEATLAPKIPPTEGLFDIVSQANGIIESIQVHQGQALVEVGETVMVGQLLISGNVELPPPLYSTEPSLWMSVPSSGSVWARTWHELTAVIPLTTRTKTDLGVTIHSYQLDLLGDVTSFFTHQLLFPTNYQKIRSTFHLPELESVPISVIHMEETPYHLTEATLNREESRLLLETRLLSQLAFLVGEDGEIRSTSFQTVESNGLLSVTLSAECFEEIGTVTEGTLRQPTVEMELPQEE